MNQLTLNFLQKNQIYPIPDGETEDSIRVAIHPNTSLQALEDLRLLLGKEVVPEFLDPEDLAQGLRNLLMEHDQGSERAEGDEEDEEDEEGKTKSHDLQPDLSSESFAVRELARIFVKAIASNTSDIHIEAYAENTLARLRIDGVLQALPPIDREEHQHLIARIKVLSKLDLAETRRPQDGRMQVHDGDTQIDVRVSVVPTQHGERAVMRLLRKNNTVYSLAELGMDEGDRTMVNDIVEHPYGLFLVTGPTGSGKSTSLYAILDKIKSPERNIITIEDPVEYEMAGLGQIPVNTKVGLTFASGLRAVLRQDPDVLMVGEIRDSETAEIAIHAALTGHLVLSTLHTNDAPTAIPRLLDLGVPCYLLSSSILGAMAQRLVRRLCPKCKEEYRPTAQELTSLGIREVPGWARFYRPVGCPYCNGGYRGRSGIYEIMTIDEDLRDLINRSEDSRKIAKIAKEKGMKTLLDDAALKVMKGITSTREALRAARI